MVCAECFEALALAATEGTVEAEAVAEGDMCMWCADVNREDNADLLLCDDCDKVCRKVMTWCSGCPPVLFARFLFTSLTKFSQAGASLPACFPGHVHSVLGVRDGA